MTKEQAAMVAGMRVGHMLGGAALDMLIALRHARPDMTVDEVRDVYLEAAEGAFNEVSTSAWTHLGNIFPPDAT